MEKTTSENSKNNDIVVHKQQLRFELQKALKDISDFEKVKRSKKACQNLISTEQFQKASVVMMFLSLPSEVDTSEAILHAWQMGKTVVVPQISWQQRHMIPVVINSLETGFATQKGLKNPTRGVPMPFEEIDMVVAPGLGFDRNGNRIGRGGSYYDRFFANKQLKAVKCAFCFSIQIVENVPVTKMDEPVDMLVCDSEIIYCSAAILRVKTRR